MFLNASSGVLNVSQSLSLLSVVTGEYNIWGLFENTSLSSLCLNCLPVSYLRLNTAQTGRRLLYAASWYDAFQCLSSRSYSSLQSSSLITHLYGAWPLASHISTWVSISPGPPICSIDYIALILAATASAFKGSVTGCDCWHGCIVTSHLDHLGLLYTATSRHGHTHTTRVGWLL